MPERVAGIDVGTNTVKLAIAERTADGRYLPLLDTARTTRLGEGAHQQRLREMAMRRTIDALQAFVGYCGAHQVQRTAVVGTAGLRNAVNRHDFVARAAAIGLDLQVISGEEEARLSYLAVRRDMRWEGASSLLVVDIGGGSTEVVAGIGTYPHRSSVPLGAVRLTEERLPGDPPTIRQMADANSAAARAAADLRVTPGGWTAVAVGGTAVNMAAVKLGVADQNPDNLHGVTLTAADVEAQVALYAERSVEERRAIVGLDPERADVILGGAIILSNVLAAIGLPAISVSTRGLRWGVLYDRFG